METNHIITPRDDLVSSKYAHSFTYNTSTVQWLDRIKQRSVATGRCTDRWLWNIFIIQYRYTWLLTKDNKVVLWERKSNRLTMNFLSICGWRGMAKHKLEKPLDSRMPKYLRNAQWALPTPQPCTAMIPVLWINYTAIGKKSQSYYIVSSHNYNRASTHRQHDCVLSSFSVYQQGKHVQLCQGNQPVNDG